MSKQIFLLAGAFTLASTSIAAAQRMYWFTDGTIQRACLNASPVRDVIEGIQIRSIALDTGSGKLYWSDRLSGSTAQIRRSNLDGTDVEILTGESNYAAAIALDTVGGKVYWIERTSEIRRSNLDGSGAEVLLTDLEWPKHLALDVGAGKMYWTTSYYGPRIMRANLDGSNLEAVLTLPDYAYPLEIALDTVAGRMYWTCAHIAGGSRSGWIHSANLDGSQGDQFHLDTDYPNGIALDLGAGKVYWGGGDYLNWAEIKRANLDGSDIEELLNATTFHPEGIALDLRPCGGPDCQPNGVPDECDICDGTSADCNTNDIPDECEPDCNSDGVPDACDPDCNTNGVSDVCDILAGTSTDTLPQGGDGIPDECQDDCNGNQIPDSDDLAIGSSDDCNDNGIPDECDIADSVSEDCDLNGVPDECEPDCNANGQLDTCDIQTGLSEDCNGNTIPDECEQDCNGNLVPDDCDIAAGTSEDQNADGYPDECEATNDFCADAIEIFAGSTPFPGLRATPDGLDLSYNCPVICEPSCPIPDIWYDYVAPDEGQVTISAVTDSGRDLSVLVFDSCSCPADYANLIGCGVWESLTFAVEPGACYRFQVESFWAATDQDAGTVTLSTNFLDPCPERPPLPIFVDADAPPGGDGLSWPTAFSDLQDALAVASSLASGVTEIRVAEGTYTPALPGGDRTATFQLPRCVAVMGGYAGLGSPDPDQRDTTVYETILSGDLTGDDPPEISDCCYGHRPGGCASSACEAAVCASSSTCCGSYWQGGCADLAEALCGSLCANFGENSYHVVSAQQVDEVTLLDGFTTMGGNANGPSPHDHGAGIDCDWAEPTIRDTTIRTNRADKYGGGVYNCDGKILDCRITGNAIVSGSGGGLEGCDGFIGQSTISGNAARFGGGLSGCDGAIEQCTISDNAADVGGGGLSYCDGTITNCMISGNTAGTGGGGAHSCNGSIVNSVISGNTANTGGGGLSYCGASVVNSTFTGNRNTQEISGGAISSCTGGFANCIFWDNTSQWWYNISPAPVDSCVPPGSSPGQGNLEADPLFNVPGYFDLDGLWVEGDYRLSSDSPCIDAGDDSAVPPDTTDLDGDGDTTEPIPFDLDGDFRFFGTVDIGAYEARGELESPTLSPSPHDILKNRYISIDPRGTSGANVGQDLDIRLTLSSTQVNGVAALGSEWWANSPDADCIAVVGPSRPATPPNWDACPTLHLTGCPIIPTSIYDIVMIHGGAESDPPMAAATQAKPGVKWRGDAVGFFDSDTNTWTPPQGEVNIDDAVAAIKTFQDPSAVNATHVSVTDVHPNLSGAQINKVVNFDDVFDQILGFQGFEYPGSTIELCTDP